MNQKLELRSVSLLAFPGPSGGLSILDHPPLLLKSGLINRLLNGPSLPFVNGRRGRDAVSERLDGGGGALGEGEGEGGRAAAAAATASDVFLPDGAGLGEEILEGHLEGVVVGGGVGGGAADDLLPDVVDGLGGGGDGLEEVVHGGGVEIGEKGANGRYR